MPRVAIAVIISLVAGFAAAALFLRAPDSRDAAPVPATSADFDANAGTGERLRALEAALAEERDARRIIERELQFLSLEVERAIGNATADPAGSLTARREQRSFTPFSRGPRGTVSPADRADALVRAGFSVGEADRILRREEELQVEAMQARFSARVSGTPPPAGADADAMLRTELGDANYERYLEATGQPTSVAVGHVLESSPGQAAGLQSGDVIVRYDGERVFEIGDLVTQTMQGTPGESVVVDIERDGAPMQIVLPRGPIGIQSARVFGRR